MPLAACLSACLPMRPPRLLRTGIADLVHEDTDQVSEEAERERAHPARC
jgi:hypothetical protein